MQAETFQPSVTVAPIHASDNDVAFDRSSFAKIPPIGVWVRKGAIYGHHSSSNLTFAALQKIGNMGSERPFAAISTNDCSGLFLPECALQVNGG
jgi:hypothetical protein